MDGDLSTYWVSDGPLNPESPPSLLLELTEGTEISAISLLGRKGYGPRRCIIPIVERQPMVCQR